MAMMNPYNYQRPKVGIVPTPVIVNDSSKMSKKVTPTSYNKNKTNQYLESKILTAKPEELTYMLYEGLVKFIKKAQIYLQNENYEGVNTNSQKAQAIIDELRSTLNPEIEISKSMDDLYEFMSHKLLMGNVNKSLEDFKDALEIAEEFKLTWKKSFNIK